MTASNSNGSTSTEFGNHKNILIHVFPEKAENASNPCWAARIGMEVAKKGSVQEVKSINGGLAIRFSLISSPTINQLVNHKGPDKYVFANPPGKEMFLHNNGSHNDSQASSQDKTTHRPTASEPTTLIKPPLPASNNADNPPNTPRQKRRNTSPPHTEIKRKNVNTSLLSESCSDESMMDDSET